MEKDSKAASDMALDLSLEKARALHRVWRALNDGDCPKCHTFHRASEIRCDFGAPVKSSEFDGKFVTQRLSCPTCGFSITREEIEAIEKMFAPAMDAAVGIFHEWQIERSTIDMCNVCTGCHVRAIRMNCDAAYKGQPFEDLVYAVSCGRCGRQGAEATSQSEAIRLWNIQNSKAETAVKPSLEPAGTEEIERTCINCGLPVTLNHHPLAGKPSHLNVVGAKYGCLPCAEKRANGRRGIITALKEYMTRVQNNSVGHSSLSIGAVLVKLDELESQYRELVNQEIKVVE